MKIQSINPYDESINEEFEQLNFSEIKSSIEQVRVAQTKWKDVSIDERCQIIKNISNVLKSNSKKYGTIITKEMGKPINEAIGEVNKCAWVCEYYSVNAKEFLKNEKIETEALESFVRFDPIGIVFAIMPWNYPFWQVFRCAIPAIVSGNACVLKHASNVPMSALAIEETFTLGGVPENVFKTLIINSNDAMKIIEDDLIDGVSLTGSNIAGEQVGKISGEKIKNLVMELGGSDPFIVLDDADIEEAAKTAVKSRFISSGQSCIAAKRFVVTEGVYGKFSNTMIEIVKNLKTGDPMDESTQIGPVAKKVFAEELEDQHNEAVEKGAKSFRGEIPNKGYFVAPTCLIDVPKNARVINEEVFGPIASIIKVKDSAEAIEVANNTEFGLGASIWTKDLNLAKNIASKIEAGCIAINDMVKSDPRLPFGGIKKSGVGRELSHYSLKEFVNIKSVVVNK